MANSIEWADLTPEEVRTLADLERRGVEIFAAPIEIEHRDQLETLGIGWSQCRTWHIGSEQVKVHLTPADEATYKLLLGDLRSRQRDEYRKKRCLIPGKLKPTIFCPECNQCSDCPYPEYRDKHQANNLSWETLIESGYEEAHQDSNIHHLEVMSELESVCKIINAKNPKYLAAIVLKEYYGLMVDEIAEKMHETKRNVYFYLSEAMKIGMKYRKDNYDE